MLAKPVQNAMKEVLVKLVPVLKGARDIRGNGTVKIVRHLRQECGAEIEIFSKRVVGAMVYLSGEGDEPPKSVLARRAKSGSIYSARQVEFADRVVRQVATLFHSARSMPDDEEIPRAVLLDPDHEASVKWVLCQALGVLHGAKAAYSMLRVFRLPPKSAD